MALNGILWSFMAEYRLFFQGNPMMMPFGPQAGLSPRMMNQINMSMAAAAAAAAQPPMGGPRGVPMGNPRLRFPNNYFM